MDGQSREKFWNTLCSLSGTDIKQDEGDYGSFVKLSNYTKIAAKHLERTPISWLFAESMVRNLWI